MAAEELNMEKLEDLRRQVESSGLDEEQRNKLITEEWRRMREADAEERRLAAQVEERRIAAEAKERWLVAQAEERRIAAQERRIAAQERRIAVEKMKAELEVEKLRLELEARRLSESQNGEQLNQKSVENIVRTLQLPSFVDEKYNLDEYLLRFERYASVVKWNRST